MALTDQQIADLESADLLVRESRAIADNARSIREREIRRIAAEGGTYREIGKVAGVAYQRVAQIVTGHEPPAMHWRDFLKHDCPRCGAEPGEECKDTNSYAHAERHDVAYRAFIAEHPELDSI